MKQRAIMDATEDAFARLNEDQDFATYLKVLEDRLATSAKGLRKLCTDQESIAQHNHLVGFMDGLRLAHSIVATMVEATLHATTT